MAASALIINADDYGLCPSVDAGILRAWAGAAISGCTVLATAPHLPTALAAARDAGLPVGVHLNLTVGVPLSPPREVPSLVDAEGRFPRREQWTTPLPRAEVRLEIRRQFARVLACGIDPTHLDSHHHVHRYAEVLAEVIALAREYHLPVRAVDEPMRQTLRDADIVTPDHFAMQFYGEQATLATLIRLVEDCPGGTLEIMTHPGYVSPDLYSRYRDARERELAVLLDSAWRDYRREHGVALLGYSELR